MTFFSFGWNRGKFPFFFAKNKFRTIKEKILTRNHHMNASSLKYLKAFLFLLLFIIVVVVVFVAAALVCFVNPTHVTHTYT